MTTETATPSKKQKKKNCKQLDFLDMIPPEKQTKDSNRQISIADQIEDDLRQRYLLRQELAQRICVKAIPEYGTLDAGILSMIVADQMRTTYDENVSRNEARDYINGIQLSFELYTVIKQKIGLDTLSYAR